MAQNPSPCNFFWTKKLLSLSLKGRGWTSWVGLNLDALAGDLAEGFGHEVGADGAGAGDIRALDQRDANSTETGLKSLEHI